MPKPLSQDNFLIPFYTKLIDHFIPRDTSISNNNKNKKQKTNLEFHMKIKSQANSKMGLSGEGNPLLI